MKLRNVLIVVSDIEESINFYRDLFGLQVVLNNGWKRNNDRRFGTSGQEYLERFS